MNNMGNAVFLTLVFLWLVVWTLIMSPVSSCEPSYNWRQVLDAVRVVETGGSPNEGRGATGDNGKALGPYQIWKIYWTDARIKNRAYKEVLNDKELSEKVIYRYMKRYQPESLRRLESGTGTLLDVEKVSRTHNGGPSGTRKRATHFYFQKVKRALALN